MSLSFNKFKSTTIYGNFQNSDLDQNNTSNANAIFDRNMLVNGTLQANDCSFDTIKFNGNIISNGLTISPTEICYLKNVSSNIQTQINSVKTQADGLSTLLTGASWDATYQYLDLAYNSHIYGILFLGPDNNLNVNSILTSLPSTYVNNTSLNTRLGNYTTTTDLSNNYVKNSILLNYTTTSDLSSNYVKNSALSSQL